VAQGVGVEDVCFTTVAWSAAFLDKHPAWSPAGQVDYDNLRAAIIENCSKNNLQPLESFIIKIIQVGVRRGVYDPV
jgi:hypothetical protein